MKARRALSLRCRDARVFAHATTVIHVMSTLPPCLFTRLLPGRFRPVQFPDPDGRAALARAYGRLSFQAGEFSATYGAVGGAFEGSFDAVVTNFFVDTAPNVVQVSFRTRNCSSVYFRSSGT